MIYNIFKDFLQNSKDIFSKFENIGKKYNLTSREVAFVLELFETGNVFIFFDDNIKNSLCLKSILESGEIKFSNKGSIVAKAISISANKT